MTTFNCLEWRESLMELIQKINLYFFGVKEITLQDSIIFYGQYIVGIIGILIALWAKVN